jgi:CubicO group peptidase (beta-lactamase class C family)
MDFVRLTKVLTKFLGATLLALCATVPASRVLAQDTQEVMPIRGARRPARQVIAKDDRTTSSKTFDLDLFEANLKKAFDGKATGYAYAINQNKQLKRSGANGYAILARDIQGILTDPKGVKHHQTLRMNIASVSKPVTAVTVLRLLQQHQVAGYPNLTINSTVAPFLPTTWKQGNKVASLTFKELMSQYSGMNDNKGATDTPALKTWIATGVTRAKSDYIYINGNLAIFRIIIPYMVASQSVRDQYNELAKFNPAAFDDITSVKYVQTVNKQTLAPMGIPEARCEFFSNTHETRFYIVPDSGLPGILAGDWRKVGGGGGWYLSALELAQFLAHVRYNDNILTPASRKLMDENYLGWMDPDPELWDLYGDHGVYLGHRGDLIWRDKNKVAIGGMTSLILNFPNSVQVALLVNSLGTYGSTHKVVADAFDASWK